MKRLGIMVTMFLIISLPALGASAQEQNPDDTPVLYSMMGGGGGMMGGGGWFNRPNNSHDRYGNMPGPSGQYRNAPESYGQHRQSDREEIDRLKRKIIEKRRELSRLYQSKNADADVMNDKIDELNRLEQQLDSRLSGGR